MFLSQLKASSPPLIAVHGGAGDYSGRQDLLDERRAEIKHFINQIWPHLLKGASAMAVAQEMIELLEASPLFNAGLGSVLQSDGQARLSASVMNGDKQKFSGVMLATHLVHPSKLAFALQEKEQTVLGPMGAQLLARELGIPPQLAVSPQRAKQWAEHIVKNSGGEGGFGTVGVVVMDMDSNLVASTSTGGWTSNLPERVSDVATVAGNYASQHAAISCTGVGEQIVDDGVSVRLETRVRDGASIIDAANKTLKEAVSRTREYGWISLDKNGNVALACSVEMPCALMAKDLPEPVVGKG